MKLAARFDRVIGISPSEYKEIGISPKRFWYIPHFMDAPPCRTETKHDFDVIYVASRNEYNIVGAKWFLDNVSPMLSELKIHFIGEICDAIQDKWRYKNIKFAGRVKDLGAEYCSVSVAVCPMFSGTGLKIKVIEAIAHGLPVISNRFGAIGMPDCEFPGVITDNPREFASAVLRLTTDDRARTEAANKSRAYFNKWFSIDVNREKLLEAFCV
jgi:glycosyltransferase involved in cell wall biosynthesis